jgi:outer membrane lipoprotein-sorting protein
MSNKEKDLSEYIDSLNAEKRPKAHENMTDSPELEELMDTIRMLKILKAADVPSPDYGKKISKEITRKMKNENNIKRSRGRWYMGAVSIAAAVILIFILNLTFARNNIVYAMEQAFQEVKAYHGTLEIAVTNEAGEETSQAKREVWANQDGNYYVGEIEGSQKGLITVNNGEKKWQIRPDSKQLYIFSSFPDPYRFTFELGKEIENVKNAIKTKSIGEDIVSGRKTIILEVSPQGGNPYKLWIDKETKLPLKKQSAMQNALQYTITYSNIDFMDTIPAELIAYNLPAGFEEINTNKEQLVNNIEEAIEAVGFSIKMPEGITSGYAMDYITVEPQMKVVKIYYIDTVKQSRVVVLQGKATSEFKPVSTAVLGKINNGIVEIQSPIEGNSGILAGGAVSVGVTNISSIRWQENGFEYAVVGDVKIEDLGLFVKGIGTGSVQIPSEEGKPSAKPQVSVSVSVDLEVEENEQKAVDAGHSPWKLDPTFVAQVFASLQISPEGIVGEYPVQYEDFKVVENTGAVAIIELSSNKTPISKVYLKKLIRQDSAGIWTVVGYDRN